MSKERESEPAIECVFKPHSAMTFYAAFSEQLSGVRQCFRQCRQYHYNGAVPSRETVREHQRRAHPAISDHQVNYAVEFSVQGRGPGDVSATLTV